MGNPERRLEMMQKHLNLSDDQTAKIKSIFADGRSQMEALRANQSLAPEDRREQAHTLMQAEQAKIDAVLTPDQQAKWHKMQERQRERMRDHRGPGGPDGPPPPPDGDSAPPPPSTPPSR
jgi:Spy/CpxP family protein refolding chaperone